jgi:hypothetical protein
LEKIFGPKREDTEPTATGAGASARRRLSSVCPPGGTVLPRLSHCFHSLKHGEACSTTAAAAAAAVVVVVVVVVVAFPDR